tara:strand:- start:700 stop:1353 length:654 start_codon:yes stop_codon:yes gene_type:complete
MIKQNNVNILFKDIKILITINNYKLIMNNYSETKVKLSLAFSLLANITNALGHLGYVQFYKPFMNYGKYYFIIDMIGAKRMYVVHHLITAFLGQIITNSYIYEYEEMNLIRIWFNTEISTIFYNSFVLTKKKIYMYLFAITFFYYRIFRFGSYILINKDTLYDNSAICISNNFISDFSTCISSLYIINYIFLIINCIWGYYIVEKAMREIKKVDIRD